MEMVTKLQQGKMLQKIEDYRLEVYGMRMYMKKKFVPSSHELRSMILKEMHNVPYDGHPEYQKTMEVVKSHYYWPGMKKEIANYITRCMECQRVKAEHRHPYGFLQPLPIPEWKCEVVTMYFIIGLPISNKHHDSIMVVVDKLTKATYCILIKLTHKAANIANIYMRESF